MARYILLFCLTISVGHVLVWFQVNGQLVWPWIRNNPLIVSLMGIPISFLFIKATQWGYEGFENQLWPLRIIGFAFGTIVFGLMTWSFLGETPDLKAWLSLSLSVVIIAIQVLL